MPVVHLREMPLDAGRLLLNNEIKMKNVKICCCLSKRLKNAILKNTPSVLDALTLSAEEAVMREAKKAGIDLFSNGAVLKAIEPSESGEYYNVTFELVPKESIIKIQLESGAEKEIYLDLITEHGCICDVRELPPCAPYHDPFPKFVPSTKHCYIKVRPFNEIVFITEESLKQIHELKSCKK